MFDTDEDRVNPAAYDQLRAALDDAITKLDLAHNGLLIRSAMYGYMRLRSRQGLDPVDRLVGSLRAARRSLSYGGSRYVDARKLASRLRDEVEVFRHHRFYPYLARLGDHGRPSRAKLDPSLNTLIQAIIRFQNLIVRIDTLAVDPGLLDLDGAAWATVPSLKGRQNAVTPLIVIPVYSGRENTLACLHSVLIAHNEAPARLLVIDDRSPEQQLTHDLQHLASKDCFDLIYHSDNRGFVSTVNEGILASRGDVVLLNADTVVCDHWLDHLHAAAQARPDLASVSPLSNNATILSYPHTNAANPLPLDSSLAKLCAFLEERLEADALIEIPTSVGFCMYMRRQAIEDIGIFDEAAFGLGYGEECDWAMRARNHGYRHYATTRSFVYHVGSVSFGERAIRQQTDAAEILRHRHPRYWQLVADHISANPLSKVRRYLDGRRLATASEQAPIILHVLHSLGGGTEAHVRHLAKLLKARGVLSLFAQPDEIGRMRLSSNFLADTPNLIFAGLWDDDEAVDLVRELNVRCLHLHHVLGFAPEVLALVGRLDIPLVVTLHDYTYICPQVVLLDHRNLFCGVPSTVICHRCIAAKRPILDVANVAEWRERMHRLVSRAERILAPSKAAVELFKRAWPNLPIRILPHPEMDIRSLSPFKGPTDLTVVAVIGAILSHKGASIVEACARDAAERKLALKFLVVGPFQTDFKSPHLEVTGRFSPPQLPTILSEAKAVIGFLPSMWPETYSYVLSEYYRFGLHPVVFDIGAQSERVRAAQYGTILPVSMGAPAINNALTAIKLDFAPRQPPTGLPERGYVEACYGKLLASIGAISGEDVVSSTGAALL
jgi:GT2 family glycosyltransferase/glycosyltransferase involved in cell wall biosynthesis